MSSFSIPLTGLESSSEALDTIANNLSNMNTTAFKSQDVSFSDLFYQQIGDSGAGNPLQVGAGVQVDATTTDFSEGSIESTSEDNNVAIDGNGFFVLQNDGGYEYTRDGNFTLTSDGYLTSSSGLSVMGYPATDGTVDTNAALTAIQIPVGATEQPQATSNFSITANLDSSSTTSTTPFSSEMTVYDSLGEAHTMTVSFTNTGTNTWSYSISLPSGDATGGSNLTGTLTFDSDGNLTSPTADVSDISFTGLSDGASDMTLDWNLFNSSDAATLTQYSSTSEASATTQDGYASGEYSGYTVDSSGVISATFSNGKTEDVGQLALASVVNEQGLDLLAGNNYSTTDASGEATIGVAGSAGLGTLEGESLEESNVDISAQFSDMIVAQQAYEASSKAVTTFDTISQDTINMIH
ncbi:flagellar hook protein FlgE [Silvibacterium dinghuense]|uniref:Flagellar hook protein FlgE n=1 Tax=Silvibacterium dinghuense TaxID=1560006 RepID=A0A4Q1SEG7_9BACT|nr:flagellar hook protein FlgE [Silvibacterium dinghuense]RXS95664.1 flagellar hook protein FlgE [Silvibacterium dinghuense]GGH14782.1 flagellar hook protein FlgE [Silvibacterium dinghuense]